jgi:hypothetical protein
MNVFAVACVASTPLCFWLSRLMFDSQHMSQPTQPAPVPTTTTFPGELYRSLKDIHVNDGIVTDELAVMHRRRNDLMRRMNDALNLPDGCFTAEHHKAWDAAQSAIHALDKDIAEAEALAEKRLALETKIDRLKKADDRLVWGGQMVKIGPVTYEFGPPLRHTGRDYA